MKYCRQCVQPDTRPGIVFDEEGVCLARRAYEERLKADWVARGAELREIARWAKQNSKGGFECTVGVSGSKDSTFQSLYVRDRLSLKPLGERILESC
ncbi:MAG: hypothetical protein KAV87_11930 [Desulfobacteraceae bacterium]|nr:hypothetical protein [Desulfobacteraceae bacterium]